MLRPDSPSLNLQEQALPVFDYFLIGIEHLVFGIDHVLFVIGLFLFIPNPIALIKTITAFTVSHSITLALSVLELVKLDQQATEAVIALSIFFLARELVQEKSARSIDPRTAVGNGVRFWAAARLVLRGRWLISDCRRRNFGCPFYCLTLGLKQVRFLSFSCSMPLLGCCRVWVSRHSFIKPLRGAWAVWLPFGP